MSHDYFWCLLWIVSSVTQKAGKMYEIDEKNFYTFSGNISVESYWNNLYKNIHLFMRNKIFIKVYS